MTIVSPKKRNICFDTKGDKHIDKWGEHYCKINVSSTMSIIDILKYGDVSI